MKKLLLSTTLAMGLLLGSCTSLADIVTSVATNAKAICGVVVNVADLTSALTGSDPNILIVDAIAHSICDQFKAQLAAANPPVAGRLKATAGATYVVDVNGKPVHVTVASE